MASIGRPFCCSLLLSIEASVSVCENQTTTWTRMSWMYNLFQMILERIQSQRICWSVCTSMLSSAATGQSLSNATSLYVYISVVAVAWTVVCALSAFPLYKPTMYLIFLGSALWARSAHRTLAPHQQLHTDTHCLPVSHSSWQIPWYRRIKFTRHIAGEDKKKTAHLTENNQDVRIPKQTKNYHLKKINQKKPPIRMCRKKRIQNLIILLPPSNDFVKLVDLSIDGRKLSNATNDPRRFENWKFVWWKDDKKANRKKTLRPSSRQTQWCDNLCSIQTTILYYTGWGYSEETINIRTTRTKHRVTGLQSVCVCVHIRFIYLNAHRTYLLHRYRIFNAGFSRHSRNLCRATHPKKKTV